MEDKKALNKYKNRIIIFIVLTAVFTSIIIVQIAINIFLLNTAKSHDAFKLGVLTKSALDSLDDLRTDIGKDNRIEEVNIELPTPGENLSGVKYSINSDDASSPQIQVTSNSLTSYGTVLLSQQNTEELFKTLPSVQACSRGFTLQLDKEIQDENLSLSGSIKLNDGRILNIYKDNGCNISYGVEELESYLLGANSY